MPTLFEKLNLKDHAVVHLLNAPASFEPALAELAGRTVQRKIGAKERVTFALAFTITQAELDAASTAMVKAAEGDAVLWIAYPKQSSKRYRCEFNRDSGWTVLGAAGFETVRMVAIDEDWSALRFRRTEHVSRMTRDPKRALSDAGRQRVAPTSAGPAKPAKKSTAKSAAKPASTAAATKRAR